MTCTDLTASQVQLLKARANRFSQYKQNKSLPTEHGLLTTGLDQCLVYGLLKHGFDAALPGELSASVFIPYNKCLTICMENGIHHSRDCCDICDSIGDLTKHASICLAHPEVCSTCKSLFNLLEYHLLSCATCDMHLCTKLKLKLMKHHSTVEGGLIELWPKIQRYISRLCPTVIGEVCNLQAMSSVKSGSARYPSVFDSTSVTPPSPISPSVVARGPDQEPTTPGAYNTPLGQVFDSYHKDMDLFTNKFGESMSMQSPLPTSQPYGAMAAPYDPLAAAGEMFMSTGLSSSPSLNLNSLETKLKASEGYGGIIMGEPRQLRQLAEYWMTLKKRLASAPFAVNNSQPFRTEVDGVILQGMNSGMHVVNGQYKKNEQWRKITYVGSGVAGKCSLAVDISTEAQFAVKKIDLSKYEGDELEYWAGLEHPNLVRLFGAMRVAKKIYIFSEFYAAGNLADFIQGQQMLDQWLSVFFLSQLLEALHYLSSKNVLHEDIKADNIFLKPDSFQLGLGDFGLSRRGPCPPNQSPVGGQHHWSPEKAKSEGHGFPADIWAVCCTFIHMLTGDPPWKKRFSHISFLHYKIADESPPVQDIPGGLLTMVDSMIRKGWTVDPSERPTAIELLKEECFQLIYGGYDRMDPIFRSHIPEPEGDEADMEFESYISDASLPLDLLVDGMENKEEAAAYLSHIYATLGAEEADSPAGAAATVSTSSSVAPLRRQYSMKPPPMESIVEELDVSVDHSEDNSLHITSSLQGERNILERRELPAISPLMLPKASATPLEKRNSWTRSNTSPSPASEDVWQAKRDTLRKQETSPAIILSGEVSTEEVGLLGEKDIFDLNPGTSGYHTGSMMTSDDGGLSLQFPSEGPLSNAADPSSSWSQNWLGASGMHAWPGDQSNTPSTSFVNANGNMMGHIPLKADSNALCGPLPDKYDLSSSLKILRDSMPSSSIEPRCILTIVNGITRIDQSEMLVRGNETWREVVDHNVSNLAEWNIDVYTYYIMNAMDEIGQEVNLDELVPREKTVVYIFPTQNNSTWQVRDGRVVPVDV